MAIDPSECLMYLLRHGATANNEADPPILQGSGMDVPLSDEGRRQAHATAEFLRKIPFVAAYSSPLLRARQTAEIVAQPHGQQVTAIDALTEVNVGQWEGRSWVEIRETDREAYRLFSTAPEHHGYLGGESLGQLQRRVVPAFSDIMRKHLGQRILVVAHNVVNRVVWAHALQIPLTIARTLSQENCSISVLRLRNEQLKLLTMNSDLHLLACPSEK